MNRVSHFSVLPLPCPDSSHSSQRSDSIMYVHNAQFSSRTFSIISPVNSLMATVSPLHVFVEGGRPRLSICVHPAYAVTPSDRHPTAVTNYNHLPQCGRVKYSGAHT